MADADVKLPGLGKVSKKTLYIGGAVAAVVVGYLYIRHGRSSSSSGTGTSGTADTTGTDTSSQDIDPQTGYPYGSPEDQAALSAQQDSGLNTNSLDNIDPSTGYPYGSAQDLQGLGLGGGGTSTTTPTAPVTNADWEQAAVADMEGAGVSAATLSAAEAGLPRYLARLTLTSAQATAVQEAVALAGPPPVGGPYSIRTAPAPAPKPAQVTVPSVTGIDYDSAASVLKSVGLVAHRGQADVGRVTIQDPKAGAKVKKGSRVTLHGTGSRPIT